MKSPVGVGFKIHDITIIEDAGVNAKRQKLWLIRCAACGNEKVLRGVDIYYGKQKTCGCANNPRVNIGERYGSLTVIARSPKNKHRQAWWDCACDCGSTVVATSHSLRSGHISTCGCSRKPNLIGEQYGRLLVVSKAVSIDGQQRWECACDCGNTVILRTGALRGSKNNEGTKSCGCLQKETFGNITRKHGLSHTKEYKAAIVKERRDRIRELGPNNYPEVERAAREFFDCCVVCGMSEEEHLNTHGTKLHVDHVHPSKPEDGS